MINADWPGVRTPGADGTVASTVTLIVAEGADVPFAVVAVVWTVCGPSARAVGCSKDQLLPEAGVTVPMLTPSTKTVIVDAALTKVPE